VTTAYAVARASEIPEGGRLIVDVGGRSIGVFHEGGRFYALLNRCPHMGAELCRGRVLGLLESDGPGQYRHDPSRKLLACPWHGWEFDLATGQSYFDPQRTRVRPYAVTVQAGGAMLHDVDHRRSDVGGELAKGPYVAETFPISVEDDYVVVTLR
jgi:3-phenylpropionate/trans-cinnamate dioxygenase ferredoxin subunit